jgi:polysaccharide export outer membrane protein
MASGVAQALAQAPDMCAQTQTPAQTIAPTQTELVTQQEANQRILDLAKNTRVPPHDYIVGRGDLISVEVFDVPELTREVRVGQTGTIGLPLVPVRLYVVGLTEIQVQQKISEILEANGLVSRPQVMVSVKERRSKPIVIVGAVARPMVYQADHPVTLVEVLAEAGGISSDASDTVIVTRQESTDPVTAAEPPEIGPEDAVPATNPSNNQPSAPGGAPAKEGPKKEESATQSAQAGPVLAAQQQPETENPTGAVPPAVSPPAGGSTLLPATITVNLSELLERGDTQNNIALQAGDVVTVPHAGIVYALGAVARPGGFVANDRAQLSTLKILALAGGLTSIAKKDQAVIIRKDFNGKQQEIAVDLAKIVKREAEDVRLMPSDILYVPPSGARAALVRASEIALAVVTAVAIYRVTYHP